jgi:hypothetical protein
MKRVNINVSEDLYNRWTNAVEYGIRTKVLTALIETTCILVEKMGRWPIIGLILDQKLFTIGQSDDVEKKS